MIRFRKWMFGLLAAWAVLGGSQLHAETSGYIHGRVFDPSGAVVPGAQVILENPVLGYRGETAADQNGEFSFANLPLSSYTLRVDLSGFQPYEQTVDVRSRHEVELTVTLTLAGTTQTVKVEESAPVQLETESTGTHSDIDPNLLLHLPVASASRGLADVLLTTPGFIANENARTHFRGSHGQITYVVDGVPISDQLQATFSTALDASTVDTVEVVTGNIPAEYGNKTAAVVNVTTKSSFGSPQPLRGSVSLGGGSFSSGQVGFQLGGSTARVGWLVSLNGSRTNRYLDPPSFDNVHNIGHSGRFFVRLDATPNSTSDFFHLTVSGGQSRFGIPNLVSQALAGQDQVKEPRDFMVSLAWLHVFSKSLALNVIPNYRTSIDHLFPSPFDTPITAAQARHLTNYGVRLDLTYDGHGHRAKLGVDSSVFPVSENFSFGITAAAFNDSTSASFNPNLVPHDLTRSGSLFLFERRDTGYLNSFYVQDTYSWRGWTLSAGVRYDHYQFLVEESQWAPRVGLAYYLKPTRTVFRISYNKMFMPPANENLLLSSSVEASALVPPEVGAGLGIPFLLVRAERQNFYEAGVQQQFGRWFRLDASYYTKDAKNISDNDQFLNTGIVFPVTLASGHIRGFDLRVDVPEHRGFDGYFSLGNAKVIARPPFSGGLFLGSEAIDVLAGGPFRLDHDQKLALAWGVQYNPPGRAWWTALNGRYDSGLVTEIEDVAAIAADPDLAFGLSFVNFQAVPPRVKGRAIWNWLVGVDLFKKERYKTSLQFQIANLTDKTGLYNFLSVFSGTHVIPPRTYSGKVVTHF